ncbi:MAG: 2-C-methyl-D-erythritol 2,4-cyclodiphosphate synthase [Clostridiales bacterium]|nr:MAG: 2-C-methyl-D-erythritol 2,4-cyclodiphosphate synthase [Clostridiales bacterium]
MTRCAKSFCKTVLRLIISTRRLLHRNRKWRRISNKCAETLQTRSKTDIKNVSIKATTTEKLGFEGEEKGISAQAVCTVCDA